MKHIVHLTAIHPPYDTRIFYKECVSLAQAGYQVTLIAPADFIIQNRKQVQVFGFPRARTRWSRPLVWIRIFRLALRTRADIYHFHNPELLLVTPCLRWITGKPVIYDIQEVYSDFIEIKDNIPHWLRTALARTYKKVEPLLAQLQSALIFADDQIADQFTSISLPKVTIYNFPTLSFVNNADFEAKNKKEDSLNILYLGSINRYRGIYTMLDAFQEIISIKPTANLFLIGPFAPSNFEKEIRMEVTKRNLTNAVRITGMVPFDQVDKYLKIAAIGWIPFLPVKKYKKNIPTKLFEYMAYRIPVVSSDLPSVQPFIQNGENGYLVNADNPSAHALAIIDILNNPQKAREMGRKGQELVHKYYNWEEMEKRLLGLYRDLLNQL